VRLLFVGGSGLISSACSEFAIQRVAELTLLSRSVSKKIPRSSRGESYHCRYPLKTRASSRAAEPTDV
jgi:hypothetical protein